MKSLLPFLSVTILFTSCSTAYRSGQTPDDVYFSPARPQAEYVSTDDKEDKYTRQDQYSYNDDRYIRMKVHNRDRWSYFDDYYRDPLAYTYQGCYCSCNYNPRLYWDNYYSPYAPKIIVYNPKSPIYTRPRTYNLHVYDGPANNPTKVPAVKTYNTPVNRTNSSSETGNVLRSIFRGSDNSSSNSNSNTGTRSTNSSSSSSSSSSSGSSSTNNGNAPVRKF
jgi:hypothetical protein